MNRLFIQPETSAEGEFYIGRTFYCQEEDAVKVCGGKWTVAAVEARQEEDGRVLLSFYESLQKAAEGESPLSAESLLKKEDPFSGVSDEETEKVAEIFGRLSGALSYGYTMYTQDMLDHKMETMLTIVDMTEDIGSLIDSIDLPPIPSISISESFEKGYKTERLRCKKENYAAGLEAEYLYHDNEEEPER